MADLGALAQVAQACARSYGGWFACRIRLGRPIPWLSGGRTGFRPDGIRKSHRRRCV